MLIDRVYTPGLAQVAYLVADEAASEVAVIDPRRDVDVYLEWAAARRMRITAILESHVHADFVSGARELAAATGAPVYAARLGETEFDHLPLDDGDEIAVGALRLRALWTPGHTPEHTAFLLLPGGSDAPVALFSGDALFAGEIGRPDLLGEEAQGALIEQLYDTVTIRLANLPDEVVVYPGHTAGSPCGKKIGDAPQTTIGQEKRFNYAFSQPDEASFVRVVMEGMPKPPAYYPAMKRVNKVGPVLLAELPTGRGLEPDEAELRQARGALVIDARSQERFAAGHIPGAVAVGLGPSFAIWAGWLTPYGRDVVLVLEDDAQFAEARTELRRIGIDHVAGFLRGGMAVWKEVGKPVGSTQTIGVHRLAEELGSTADGPLVLDVRDHSEWSAGAIPGSINCFVGDIAQGAMPGLEDEESVAVVCGSGYRSMVAASLLQARGVSKVVNVTGGMEAWRNAGLRESRPSSPVEDAGRGSSRSRARGG